MSDMSTADAAAFLFNSSLAPFGLFFIFYLSQLIHAYLVTILLLGFLLLLASDRPNWTALNIRGANRRVYELLLLIAAPVFIIIIALCRWPKGNAPVTHENIALDAVTVFVYAQLALGLYLLWRHRNRLVLTTFVVLFAAAWVISLAELDCKAITNNPNANCSALWFE